MNKIVAVFATLLVTTVAVGAPGVRDGNRGGFGVGRHSAPARTVRSAAFARPAGRPAVRPSSVPSTKSMRCPSSVPVAKASRTVKSRSYVSKPAQIGPRRPSGAKVETIHRKKPPRRGFGYHPRPFHRHWMRPPMPPIRPFARYAWIWIATPWTILVDGVYCSGDGYWFDGYNYYYNDCYYTTAPVSVSVSVGF